MKDASLSDARNKLRSHYQKLRQKLSFERRVEARDKLISKALPCTPKGLIISYASFSDELDVWPLNWFLAAEGRLVLPRVSGDALLPFVIQDPERDLERSSWNILEPKLNCLAVSPHDITGAFVPGLVFDKRGHRLGYGKGYWDRFLSSISHCHHFGLCFKEQVAPTPLPTLGHDVPMSLVIAV